MVDALGGSVRVDSNGRTTVTGAGSDIDFGATVEKIVEAKRQPAVRLESRIAENQLKVDAMTDLQNRLSTLQQAADQLRGKPTFDNSGNVFEAKEGFLTATRSDSLQASTATSIMTANVENAAQPGSYDLEVLRTAQGQQVAGGSVPSASTALDSPENVGASFTGGTFTVNGREVTVAASDSLLDVRDKINAANSGNNATGVNAQVVSISDSEAILTLTAETPGETIGLEDNSTGGSESPLQELGLVNGSGQFVNELRQAETSIFRINGLKDGSVQETKALSIDPSTNVIADATGIAAKTEDLAFEIDNGTVTTPVQTVSVNTATDSLQDVADRVNTDVFGVSARVITEDNGNSRLEFNAEKTSAEQRSTPLSIDPAADNLDTLSAVESGTAKIRITHTAAGGATTSTEVTITTGSENLNDLESKISNATGVDVTAQVSPGGDGTVRLDISSADGGKISITDIDGNLTQGLGLAPDNDVPTLKVSDSGGTLKGDLGIDVADAVSRKTNTIDDLLGGTTINLFKAERGTDIQFDIERDQDVVNTAIRDFVTAYNDVKQFINAQRLETPIEGQDPNAENSVVGALRDDSILRQVEQRLSGFLANGARNSTGEFSVLAQAGIEFVDNKKINDATLEDTLQIDQQKLNDRLLNDFDDLGKLFQFGFSSSNSNLQMTGYTGATSPVDANLEISATGGVVDGVKVDGVEVDFEPNGRRFTIEEGALKGLSLLFSGTGNGTETASISTSDGIGSAAFFDADKLSNNRPRDGIIQSEIDRIIGRSDRTGLNDRLQEQVDRIDRSLTREREALTRQFIAMEQALLELESARDRLSQFAASLSSGD
jgi:flagellar hook-associated protein 2